MNMMYCTVTAGHTCRGICNLQDWKDGLASVFLKRRKESSVRLMNGKSRTLNGLMKLLPHVGGLWKVKKRDPLG